jgi:hypothetical protein
MGRSQLAASPGFVRGEKSRKPFSVVWREQGCVQVVRWHVTGKDRSNMRDDAGHTVALQRPLRVLTTSQVEQIDDALATLGPFAEVRLIKHRGKLRFIQKLDSEKAIGFQEMPQMID